MPQSIYDWIKIKEEFVQGIDIRGNRINPTLKELSAKYGMSHSYLRNKAAADHWTAAREKFKQDVESKKNEKKAEEISNDGAEFDASLLRIAKAGVGAVQQRIVMHLQAAQRMASGSVEEPHYLDVLELARVAQAANTFQRVGKVALGEPTETTKEIIQSLEVIGEDDDWPSFIERYGENILKQYIRDANKLARDSRQDEADSDEPLYPEKTSP